MGKYLACIVISIFCSCSVSRNGDSEVSQKRASAIEDLYGKNVKIIGKFQSTKGYAGVVQGVIIPAFLNRKEEVEKFENQWVEVTGILKPPLKSDPQKPRSVFLGPRLDMETIKTLEGKNLRESIELLE